MRVTDGELEAFLHVEPRRFQLTTGEKAGFDLRDTRDAARKALAVLRDVEWRDDPRTPSGALTHCASCEVYRSVGRHNKDCALAEAIRDLEAAL